MTGQTRSLKVMYSALDGQVHDDFMCSIIGPAGRLFASFKPGENLSASGLESWLTSSMFAKA